MIEAKSNFNWTNHLFSIIVIYPRLAQYKFFFYLNSFKLKIDIIIK